MSFNFQKAIADSSKNTDSLLSAIILGSSGAGKSSILGTMPGKILYLYTTGESHGPTAARSTGGDRVVPICIDKDGDSRLGPDAAYERLLSILTSVEGLKSLGIKSIAIDGAAELEHIVRGMDKWAKLCLTTGGKHSGFEEPRATITLLRPIITALKDTQAALGLHCAMTCTLDVRSVGANGEVEEATPRIQGYSVAEALVQQFSDVLVVGRMQREGIVKHKLQFMTDVTKVSKDDRGTIKKAINFAPRVSGILVGDLPVFLDANLVAVLALKETK